MKKGTCCLKLLRELLKEAPTARLKSGMRVRDMLDVQAWIEEKIGDLERRLSCAKPNHKV